MSDPQSHSEAAAVARSFAEHVRAFHRSLPAEEQILLEEVFALAERARVMDTEGHLLPARVQKVDSFTIKQSMLGGRELKINALGELWSNPLGQ